MSRLVLADRSKSLHVRKRPAITSSSSSLPSSFSNSLVLFVAVEQTTSKANGTMTSCELHISSTY